MIKLRTLRPDEIEYKKLKAVAAALEVLSKNNASYVVRDVYLDLGQDWMWTTICREGYRDCQILSPRDWRDVMVIETADDLALVVDHIRNDDYFND
jgi:hypothetical protein